MPLDNGCLTGVRGFADEPDCVLDITFCVVEEPTPTLPRSWGVKAAYR